MAKPSVTVDYILKAWDEDTGCCVASWDTVSQAISFWDDSHTVSSVEGGNDLRLLIDSLTRILEEYDRTNNMRVFGSSEED